MPADPLICGDEAAVPAHAAYHSHARHAALKARGIKPRPMRWPNKNHPVLLPGLKRSNRPIGRRRCAVETVVATLKRRMGRATIRYRGLVTAAGQMLRASNRVRHAPLGRALHRLTQEESVPVRPNAIRTRPNAHRYQPISTVDARQNPALALPEQQSLEGRGMIP